MVKMFRKKNNKKLKKEKSWKEGFYPS